MFWSNLVSFLLPLLKFPIGVEGHVLNKGGKLHCGNFLSLEVSSQYWLEFSSNWVIIELICVVMVGTIWIY